LDALICDFDGVVVDSEPVHLACFREVLASVGIELTTDAYYTDYLGYDDHDCFEAVGRDNDRPFTEDEIADMTTAKTALCQRVFGESVQALPGAVELIAAATAAGIPVGVCSGALRDEIELAARTVGVLEHFQILVAARDVQKGKPDPEGYHLARENLSEAVGRPLAAERCVVIEDSPAGIDAAVGAGMRVLAVTNSYAADALTAAHRIVDSLADVTVDVLRELV
jgi:beta-phosphoglucomutase